MLDVLRSAGHQAQGKQGKHFIVFNVGKSGTLAYSFSEKEALARMSRDEPQINTSNSLGSATHCFRSGS